MMFGKKKKKSLSDDVSIFFGINDNDKRLIIIMLADNV